MFGSGFGSQPTFGSSGQSSPWSQGTPQSSAHPSNPGSSPFGALSKPQTGPFGTSKPSFGSSAADPGDNPFQKHGGGNNNPNNSNRGRNQSFGGSTRSGHGTGGGGGNPFKDSSATDDVSPFKSMRQGSGFGGNPPGSEARSIFDGGRGSGGRGHSTPARGDSGWRDQSAVGSTNTWNINSNSSTPTPSWAGRGGGARQYNCRVCQAQFPDRPQLQQHLADSGHYNTPSSGAGQEQGPPSTPQFSAQSYQASGPTRGSSGDWRSDVGAAPGFGSGAAGGRGSFAPRGQGYTRGGRGGGRGEHKGAGRGLTTGRGRGGRSPGTHPTPSGGPWRKVSEAAPQSDGHSGTGYQTGDDSQLEYSEDEDERGGAGSETSHVSAEDNDDGCDSGSDGEGSNTNSHQTWSEAESTHSAPSRRGTGDPGGGESVGGVAQQAPPGTASSNSLLKRLKKPAPADLSGGGDRPGPTADKPFFSSKFNSKPPVSNTVTFSSSTKGNSSEKQKGAYSDSNTSNLSDYNSGLSGDERTGPTADKPFFSKKFSGKPAAKKDYSVLDNTSDKEAAEQLSDVEGSPSKSSHSDGQLVGLCLDMCPASERSKRLDEKDYNRLELPYPKGYSDPSFPDSTVDLSDPSRTMIKKLQRSAADHVLAIPELVRPPPVLLKTMRYLESYVMEKDLHSIPDVRFDQKPSQIEVYLFVWDRLRMIAKDFILQNYRYGGRNDRYCIECFENMARWHVMMEHQMHVNDEYRSVHSEQNSEQLNRYLKSLNEIYDDAASRLDSNGKRLLLCPNESEFRAYYIFQQLDNEGQVEAYIHSLSAEVLRSDEIQFALSVVAARRTDNYAKFFRLVREAVYLESCSLFRYMGYMRILALRIMAKICRPAKQEASYLMSDIQRLMLFDSIEDTIEFIEYCGLNIVGSDPSDLCVVLDGRNVIDSLPTHKKSGAPVLPETTSMFVYIESKARTYSRGDVVVGRAGRHCVSYDGTGADEQAFYRAQLLQQRQLNSRPAATPAAPKIAVNTANKSASGNSADIFKTKRNRNEETSSVSVNHMEAKMTKTEPKPFEISVTGAPTVGSVGGIAAPPPATAAAPPVVAPGLNKAFQFNADTPAFVPGGLPSTSFGGKTETTLKEKPPAVTAADKPTAPSFSWTPPSAVVKPTAEITAVKPVVPSIPEKAVVKDSPPPALSFPSFTVPSKTAPPAGAPPLPPAAFSLPEKSKPALTVSTKVGSGDAEAVSGNNERAPVEPVNVAPMGTIPLPTFKGINAPAPPGGKNAEEREKTSASSPSLYSFADLSKPVQPAVAASPALSVHKGAIGSSPQPVDDFDPVAAAAKVVKAISFTPRSNRYTTPRKALSPSAPLSPVVSSSLQEAMSSPPWLSYVSSTGEGTEDETVVDDRSVTDEVLSESGEKLLTAMENHLSRRIDQRRVYKALHVWRICLQSKLRSAELKRTAILFKRWRRLHTKRMAAREEFENTMRTDTLDFDLSSSMLTPFAKLTVAGSSGLLTSKDKTRRLEDCRESLGAEDFSVASLVGPALFRSHTAAFRAAYHSPVFPTPFATEVSVLTTDNDTGPLWPGQLFWKMICVSTDRLAAISPNGYCASSDEPIVTSLRSLLCSNSGHDACGTNSELVEVLPSVTRTVHAKCVDVRTIAEAESKERCSGHAVVLICPLQILHECVDGSTAYVNVARSVLLHNPDTPIVLIVTVSQESEALAWGEIDMDNSQLSPPWGITLAAIESFFSLLDIHELESNVRGVYAVNAGAEGGAIGQVVGSLAQRCLEGIISRVVTDSCMVTCPLIQRLYVPSWVSSAVQREIILGESKSDHISEQPSFRNVIKTLIDNVNRAVNACSVRIEAELSHVGNHDRLHSILATDFAIRNDSSVGYIPGGVVDDWQSSYTQSKGQMHIQQLLQLWSVDTDSLGTLGQVENFIGRINEVLLSMHRDEQRCDLNSSPLNDLQYALPGSVAEDGSKQALSAAHGFISSMWLPAMSQSDDSSSNEVIGGDVDNYVAVLRGNGWSVADEDAEPLKTALQRRTEASNENAYSSRSVMVVYAAAMRWFYGIMSRRQAQLLAECEGTEGKLQLYVNYVADRRADEIIPPPKQLDLLKSLREELVTPNRKRPWEDLGAADRRDAKVKSRCEDSLLVACRAERSDSVESLYKLMYPTSAQGSTACIAGGEGGGAPDSAFRLEADSAKKLEDRLQSILRVPIPELQSRR